jgi:lipopolysaccharide transport system permease protein
VNPHLQHPTSPLEIARSFWRNRSLIWQLTRRQVIGRYRGSVMGLAWSFFNPILMLLVFTFVFSVVFKARWGIGAEESKTDFAIILFVGMIIHGLFSDCVNSAPGLILSNVNYVKKVVFPLEILPWVAMGSALFHALVSLAVWAVFYLLVYGGFKWTAVFFPVVILPLVLATMGIAWMLTSLGVFVRDITQVIGILTTVLLFLSPIFYPVSALPQQYQALLHVNPLTFMIEEARAVLIRGRMPDWAGWAVYFPVSIVISWIGFWWFQRTRKGFADVI